MLKKNCLYLIFVVIVNSCANIVAPSGGEKDLLKPQKIKTTITENPGKYTLEYLFDEYIVLNEWDKYFYISPPLKNNPLKKIISKKFSLEIQDSLKNNVNYYISLNKCIKDLNEGNILDTLFHMIYNPNNDNSDTLRGILYDSFSKSTLENAWIMLFDEEDHDSIIFKSNPKYISKTDKEGKYIFPNIQPTNYKIFAITNTDFFYSEGDLIGFYPFVINTKIDSFISLFAFDPVVDSVLFNISDSILLESAFTNQDSVEALKDTLLSQNDYGSLSVTTINKSSCVFVLSIDGKQIKEFIFHEPPFVLKKLAPGEYNLKYIEDKDANGAWTTGSWKNKQLPEKTEIYPAKITIRSNWDLELIWDI